MREIGSEFWNTELLRNEKFFMTGRTALEYVIRDAMAEGIYLSALLPSYCCHTMIEPFIRNNINVRFYDVVYEDDKLSVELPDPIDNEMILIMRYFGYESIDGYDYLSRWKLVIEDFTHSCFTETAFEEAGYRIASLRKWSGFTGLAFARKTKGDFIIDCGNVVNMDFCRYRREAQIKKAQYIANEIVDKNEYLEAFSKAEDIIDKDYVGYMATQEDIEKYCQLNKEYIKNKRRENAAALINELVLLKDVQLMWNHLGDRDVPLNVPILVDSKIRDRLQKYLIDNRIYCPVHWPLSELHKDLSEDARIIYGKELSLICDQRYGREDMLQIARCIKEFFR